MKEMIKTEIQPVSGETAWLIKTPCGTVKGAVSAKGDCVVYKGIRYAEAERFRCPVEVTHWDGVYEADRFGSCSYQTRAFYDEEKVPEKAFYYHEFREGESYTYSEDCLFLNIWTPLNAEHAPVLFYIHGGGVTKGFTAAAALKEVEPFWREMDRRVAEACGRGMREAEPSVIFDVFNKLSKERPSAAMVCGPIVDGEFLPEQAMEIVKNGGSHMIPYLMGSTSEDIVPPIVHMMAKGWARLQSDLRRCPSYTFFFDRQLPGDDCGAWHSSDLWYAFGTLENSWRPFEPWDRQLSDSMVRYYSNFARMGNPNGGGLPLWLPMAKGQNRVMRFGDKAVAMGGVSVARLNHTMRTKPSVGE